MSTLLFVISIFSLVFYIASCGSNNLESSPQCSKNLPVAENSCYIPNAAKTKCFQDMVFIKAGTYEVGTDEPVFLADGESPSRLVHLDDFCIDMHEVSNQQFSDFVKATSYVTEAEKFGSSFVFSGILGEETKSKISKVVASAPWWMPVVNASWKYPEGPNSSIIGLLANSSITKNPLSKIWHYR